MLISISAYNEVPEQDDALNVISCFPALAILFPLRNYSQNFEATFSIIANLIF